MGGPEVPEHATPPSRERDRMKIRRIYILGSLAALSLLSLVYWRNASQLKYLVAHEEKRNIITVHHSTTTYTNPSITSTSPQRFVIGLNYWEQTNMALGNMFALNRLSKDWSVHLVCPFTMNSRLYGLPNLLADHKWAMLPANSTMLSLEHLFNINYLNLLGKSYNLTSLINFNVFLRSSNRYITVVHFIHERESREKRILLGPAGLELRQRLSVQPVFQCQDYPNIKPLAHDIITSLNNLAAASDSNTKPFVLYRYFCINASKVITPTFLAEKCGLKPFNADISVIVVNWRGIGDTRVVKNSAKGFHRSQRLVIRNMTLRTHPKGNRDVFKHSLNVLRNASYFLSKLKLTYNKFIGIHIRSEKLGIRSTRISKFIGMCMRKAMELTSKFQEQFGNFTTVVLTDYGTHGSDSCVACKGAKKIQNILAKYNMYPVEFNPLDHPPSFYDSGFVAAVEMEMLVKARYIILVGGGAFQKQIAMQKHKFSSYKTRNSVVKVCWEDNMKMQFYN